MSLKVTWTYPDTSIHHSEDIIRVKLLPEQRGFVAVSAKDEILMITGTESVIVTGHPIVNDLTRGMVIKSSLALE
jgi:hypothetical protein